MEISGSYRFKAAREIVWDVLLDPLELQRAIPGCERLEASGPGRFDIVVRIGVAALKGTYRGTITLTDVQAPDSYLLAGSAVGDLGAVAGEAAVELAAEGEETVMKYRGDLRAQGALARLGARVLQGGSSLILAQFFKSMRAQVEQRVP